MRFVHVALLSLAFANAPSTAPREYPVAPSALTSTAASRSSVSLAWSAGDPAGTKVAVERKVLGAAWPAPPASFVPSPTAPSPSTIAVLDGTAATDTKIEAYTTYVYRVRTLSANNALSAPSNEITVGPPPVGFSTVVATPKAMQAHDPAQFARIVRATFDANGDPSIAYVTYDLNNDGELPDTELSFITWNRARYRWNAPVSIDTVGNVANAGSRLPVAVAHDESTGAFGVLYLVGQHELRLALSADGGLTWKNSSIRRNGPDDDGFSTPALAMAAGRVHIAYATGSSAVTYRAGPATDASSKWTTKLAPKLPNAAEFRAECVALVLDATGKPGVSYCMNASEGYNLTATFWRPETGQTVKIADTNSHQMDDPAVELAAVGSDIAVAFYANRDEQFFQNHHIWFVRSRDGGASFLPPVIVADDGGNSMGSPVSVTIDKAAHFAMTAELAGGNDGAVKCGLPKLMRSADCAAWTTCAPDTKGLGTIVEASSPVAMFAGNDKLYIAFKVRSANAAVVPGLTLWRER
jgi:hypothetical protein